MKKICLMILLLLLCTNAFAEMDNGVSRYGMMEWGTDPWGDTNIFRFGEEIPLEDMQGNALTWDNINWEETILPSPHVIKVTHAKKIFTGDIGKFTINWSLTNGVKFIREYETGDTPAKDPVIIYYNTETKAPQVNISSIPKKKLHYNSLVNEPPDDPKDEDPTKKYMDVSRELITAKGPDDITLTYIILQCDEHNPDSENDFLGIEIIQIKEYIPDVPDEEVHVGSRLFPFRNFSDSDVYSGIYAHILTGNDAIGEGKKLIYQHNVANSPQYKYVWAIGENDNPAKMEIIWMRKGIRDVEWPYEYRQYTSRWPLDAPEKYQLYVRGDETVQGPSVTIPSDLNPEIVKQNFISAFHDAEVSVSAKGHIFKTNGSPGWVLLKYATGPQPGRFWVGFE
ncbi:secreted protein, partial [Candidatus Magnetomorum sp. HK-1]